MTTDGPQVVDLSNYSEAFRAKLRQAEEAISEYAAQQQIIFILLERLGGSVTIGLESMVELRVGKFLIHQDSETGATTISIERTPAARSA